MQLERIAGLAELSAQDWNALLPDDDPFMRYEFLEALERHGCVGTDTGWTPCHVLLRDGGRLVGAMPLYAKTHSWGEFVFDWNWAQAYRRAGVEYYPKLLSAVPFTPTTGARLLIAADADADACRRALATALPPLARKLGMSSVHVNYTSADDQAALESAGFLPRHDCRFLWRNQGYASFDDYLARFRADKRKKARRERRRIEEAGIAFRTAAGETLDDASWVRVFDYSQQTFLRHGNPHYLSAAFLADVAKRLPGQVIVKIAERDGRAIGGAIFFRSRERLYGRYWGADGRYDALHFEACYYQGIEYCIRERLASFDPGTQGEHKLARGFEPTTTSSAHWIAAPAFRAAIARYLDHERDAIADYVRLAGEHLPYQRDGGSVGVPS